MTTKPEFRREELALSGHRDALRERFPLPASATSRRGLQRIATGACTFALLAAALYWADPSYHSARHSAAVGERREIALADGSRVTLNTGTDLEVAWHLRSRRLELRRGEAHFEVARSQYRPFVVGAGGGSVEVTGTAFNLRLERAGAKVTVVEGHVLARSGDTSTPLVAGEEIAWSDGHLAGKPQPVNANRPLPWREGKLVFEGTPLKAALTEVQRYRSAPIILHDDGIGDLRLSGVYDTDRTDALLRLLPAALPVQVAIAPDGRAEIRRTASR